VGSLAYNRVPVCSLSVPTPSHFISSPEFLRQDRPSKHYSDCGKWTSHQVSLSLHFLICKVGRGNEFTHVEHGEVSGA
jgi:hypothetical protein